MPKTMYRKKSGIKLYGEPDTGESTDIQANERSRGPGVSNAPERAAAKKKSSKKKPGSKKPGSKKPAKTTAKKGVKKSAKKK